MKKRTSNVSRRSVSLLMSLVLTLTLVTPAAFATEVVDVYKRQGNIVLLSTHLFEGDWGQALRYLVPKI